MQSKEEYERKRNERLARLLARAEQTQSKGESLVFAIRSHCNSRILSLFLMAILPQTI